MSLSVFSALSLSFARAFFRGGGINLCLDLIPSEVEAEDGMIGHVGELFTVC